MASANELLLIPTEKEAQLYRSHSTCELQPQLCGFGGLVAGIRASMLIAQHKPQKVWLLGIAGAYGEALETGEAYCFTGVAQFGVGVGAGSNYQPAEKLGWLHWQEAPQIGDVIPLQHTQDAGFQSRRLLLSVASASANPEEACEKQRWYPEAVAEDMETFAVAAACRLLGVDLSVIRGISNRAGDRRHAQWKTSSAMRSAARLLAVLSGNRE